MLGGTGTAAVVGWEISRFIKAVRKQRRVQRSRAALKREAASVRPPWSTAELLEPEQKGRNDAFGPACAGRQAPGRGVKEISSVSSPTGAGTAILQAANRASCPPRLGPSLETFGTGIPIASRKTEG